MTTPPQFDQEPEHPVVAGFAIAAIVSTILLISWARYEVHGTGDLEAALFETPEPKPSLQGDVGAHEIALEEALTSSRWASAF